MADPEIVVKSDVNVTDRDRTLAMKVLFPAATRLWYPDLYESTQRQVDRLADAFAFQRQRLLRDVEEELKRVHTHESGGLWFMQNTSAYAAVSNVRFKEEGTR